MKRKFCFFLLLCIPFLLLSGCLDFGSDSGRDDKVAVTGTVKDKQDRIPVSDAIIWLGEEKTTTGDDGVFQFAGVKEGTYNLQVERKGYNAYSSSVVVGSSSEVFKASNNFDVELHTHLGILDYPGGFHNYQIAGYVFPNEELTMEEIEGAYLESPIGEKEFFVKREYFGRQIYSTDPNDPFNVDSVEEGNWKLIIQIEESEDIIREIPVYMSNIPEKAELISPFEDEQIETETPEFEFELPEKGLRRATLHVYKGTPPDTETIIFEDISLDSNTFSLEEPLDPGAKYFWRIYTIISGSLPVRYQTVTETISFEVVY